MTGPAPGESGKMASYFFSLADREDIRLEQERLDPAELAPDEILCRTVVSAVSPGTELAAYAGLPPLRPTANPYPRFLGYMNVGEVIAPERHGWPVGSLVYSHAAHRSLARLKANAVLAPIPAGLVPERAAPAYLYRLGLNALRRGRFEPGRTIAVLGLGAIGLATVQLTAHLGGTAIAISDAPEALAIAARSNANTLTRSEADGRLRAESGRDGGLADITIATTNAWNDWQRALALTRFNGAVSVLGFPGRGEQAPEENPLASALFYDRQLTLAAAGFAPGKPGSGTETPEILKEDIRSILGWIAEGALQPEHLVSRTISAVEYPGYCHAATKGRREPGTVLLDWRDFSTG